jgi:hypothetical protein
MKQLKVAVKRLQYSLVGASAGAVVALSMFATTANAAVVFVDLSAIPIAVPNDIDGAYLNLVNGVTGASEASVPGWDINPYNNTQGLAFYSAVSPSGVLATGTPGVLAVATSLSFGDSISPLGQYNQFQTTAPSFQSVGTRYVGFRFLNEGTSQLNYAWLEIQSGGSPSPNGGFPSAILRYAYENTGLSITAGEVPPIVSAVPEPQEWALMLAGLGFVSAIARRKRASASGALK